MADCTVMADPKVPVVNLVGPEAMSHNVYNHILLSPTQVSRNRSLPPNQSSVLIGGRSRAGDRVIENFNSSAGNLTSQKPVPKEDGLQFSTSTSTSCILEDYMTNEETSRVEEADNVCTITESACLLPSKDDDDGITTDDKEESELPPEECEYASQDDKDAVTNQIHNVEDFIKLHLKYSSEKPQTSTSNEPSTSQNSGADEPSCSVNVLQQLAQKTNDIIKHNRQLQQQISALKKETTLQTKVLTKLLRKKQRRLQTSTKTKL